MIDPNRLPKDLRAWFTDGLVIAASAIHGTGVFSDLPIARGSTLIRLGGNFFHQSARRSELVLPSTTTAVSEDVLVAEPADGAKDISDFLNHSCDPNVGFQDALTVVAIRDIPIRSELLIDYTFFEADIEWRLKSRCNCGAPSCRHEITGRDWTIITPDNVLYLYYSPFIQRRIIAKYISSNR